MEIRYQVVKIYAMLSYPNTTKYDKTSNTGGVIPGFVNNIAFNSGVRTCAKLCLISHSFRTLSYPNTTKYDKTSNTGGVIPGFVNNIAFNSRVRTFAKSYVSFLFVESFAKDVITV